MDHVLPRSRGGATSWLNAVAACDDCNARKGNQTPDEAGIPLRWQPYVPTRVQLRFARADARMPSMAAPHTPTRPGKELVA